MWLFVIALLMSNGQTLTMQSKAPFTTLEDCRMFGSEKVAELKAKLEADDSHGVEEFKAYCNPVVKGTQT